MDNNNNNNNNNNSCRDNNNNNNNNNNNTVMANVLGELNDILDLIDIEDYDEPFHTDDDIVGLHMTISHLVHDFVERNIHIIPEEDYDNELDTHVKEFIIETIPDELMLHDNAEEQMIETIDCAISDFFKNYSPPRSYSYSAIFDSPYNYQEKQWIDEQIQYLKKLPQPQQRTPEWYIVRSKLLSASSAHKMFDSQATMNQLIYEKCQKWRELKNTNANNNNNNNDNNIRQITIKPDDTKRLVNVNSPLHWGQKYEPVSNMLYCKYYNVDIDEFGCIPHNKYHFIGASPDGIVTTKTSPRFGRLLEIKNIVNREITGIPKKEYWIQMQLQMEVCGLNECDFFETKFVEYESASEFYADTHDNDDTNKTLMDMLKNDGIENAPRKGIMLYFLDTNMEPIYIYKPLEIENTPEISNKWCEDEIGNYMETHEGAQFIDIIFWKLEIASCVLVPRNREWFMFALPQIRNTWDIIVMERDGNYAHRAPKSRSSTNTITNYLT